MTFGWITILLVGAVLRLTQTLGAGFPLGDGGLFHAAIDAIQSTGGLPETIPYNDGIPYVYPPLGFLVAAAMAALPGLDTTAVLRIMPPMLSIAVVAIAPWTAARLTGSPRAGLLAGAMVAVMPQAYDELVAGGGVTRGLGVLLALAAIGITAGHAGGLRRAGLSGLLLGLAALTHPQVAIFALVTVAFVWWWHRAERSWREVGVTLLLAAVVVTPWLVLLTARGQVDALLSGGQRLDPIAGLVGLAAYPAMQAMHGGIPNPAVALSIVGVAASLLGGGWRLPVWLLVVHALACPTFVSSVAWAIAGAAGIDEVATRVVDGRTTWRLSRSSAIGLGVVALVAILSASASASAPGSKQQPLMPAQVDAARAMSVLPADARVAVITSETWGNDQVGEWLPALSGRVVVTTPQGSEWLGREAFAERRRAHDVARSCHRLTSECLASALSRAELRATHIVIPRGSVGGPRAPDECCPALIETILVDDRFIVVLNEPGALVLRWEPAAVAARTGHRLLTEVP
jgi:hypothetical protein